MNRLRRLCLQQRTSGAKLDSAAEGHNRTHAVQQTLGRAFPAVSFVYLPRSEGLHNNVRVLPH